MSKIDQLWDEISNLTMAEKIVLYKRLKYEVLNKSINIYGLKKDENKEDYMK